MKGLNPSLSSDGRPRLIGKISTTHYLGDGPKRKADIRHHLVAIESIEPGVKLHKAKVKVSCACEDFCMVWEYALNKRGAANIYYCNGQKPVEKNPALIPGVCKHLFRMLDNIKTMKI